VSGILFTANPVSGARDEVAVNAVRGLGEAVVGGLTTPDSFTLDRTTLAVRERKTGLQEVESVLAEHGTRERPLEPERAAQPTLDDTQLARLAQIGVDIEDLFGTPQDIEWAYVDGRFWVLQARPITNLPPAPLADVRWDPSFPDSAWWRRQVVENMPEPLSPLFDELYLREGLEFSIDAMMEFFRMTYFRVEDFVDRPLLRRWAPGRKRPASGGFTRSPTSMPRRRPIPMRPRPDTSPRPDPIHRTSSKGYSAKYVWR
jgi:rifampicin phosphotransferase